MRLSAAFLAPYLRQSDVFPNLLARSVYASKYRRGTETWAQTCQRCVEGNVALDPTVSEDEAQKLYHAMFSMQFLPPGRGLWTGGVPGVPVEARYNCAKGTTRFWADGELRTLKEMVDQRVMVICKDGQERLADVRAFGVQRLVRITFGPKFARSLFSLTYEFTKDHRWFTSNRGLVTDLTVGDRVLVTPRQPDKSSEAYRAGLIHGLVYGDGCAVKGRDKNYQIRLCGKKSQWLDTLVASEFYRSHSYPPSYNGDPHVRLRSNASLDALPSDAETFDYQAGFLDGWLAMDGFSVHSAIGLEVTDPAGIAWIRERAPQLGYCITGHSKTSNTETNLGKRNGQPERLIMTTNPQEYYVRAIEDTGVDEEVFCVVEPETTSFTIEGGLPTGNCFYCTLRSTEDWCWLADMLMCGGGVGLGLYEVEALPVVERGSDSLTVGCVPSHPDAADVAADVAGRLSDGLAVDDSREGWVDALRYLFAAAYAGRPAGVDVSSVRPCGAPIRTFGGIAPGPAPLASLLRRVWAIVRGAAGRRLNSVECLDITNHIGLCVKSGNVRRSALIALGNPGDQGFRDAKKDMAAVMSHRSTSNNSVVFRTHAEARQFDYDAVARDLVETGEPGLVNLARCHPLTRGVNPCAEVELQDREACCLSEVFLSRRDGRLTDAELFRLAARYTLRQRLTPMIDAESEDVRRRNMRLGVGLGGVCDFEWSESTLRAWYRLVREECDHYADALKVARPIAVTTVKPGGTVSLVASTSPGMHAPFADYYLRRTRIATNEPMAAALQEAGVPHEVCQYDATGRTLVFEFPVRSAYRGPTVQTESTRDQFERQLALQNAWSDNAVSATIGFDPGQVDHLAELLREYAPQLKSTSCLPRDGGIYPQAPYQTIDRAEYKERHGKINHLHPLMVHADDALVVEECEGGACPTR